MAREKFQTLTEQMFYILLALQEERCGADIMALVAQITQNRVTIGPGTLYNLLEDFLSAGGEGPAADGEAPAGAHAGRLPAHDGGALPGAPAGKCRIVRSHSVRI